MSIKVSDVAVNFDFHSWAINPGHIMHTASLALKKSDQTTRTLYLNFINNKIPAVRNLLSQLIQDGKICVIHLPFTLKMIFSSYLDELIEHYQNQLDQRDEAIDEQLLEIKHSFSKNLDLPWANNRDILKKLFLTLKHKLTLEGALPTRFDKTIDLWNQILTIPYMGNMLLAAFYEKSAERKQITFKEDPHRVDCSTLLSRANLEQAFHLLLQQLSRDVTWVTQEMVLKTPILDNQELDQNIREFTNDKEWQLQKPLWVLVRQYTNRMNILINRLNTLNLMDTQSVWSRKSDLMNTGTIVCTQRFVGGVPKDVDTFSGSNGSVRVSDLLIEHLEKYSEATDLKKYYLDDLSDNLEFIMNALCKSNQEWTKFKETNQLPVLISQLPSILPPVIYNSNVADEFLASFESPKAKPKKTPSPPQDTSTSQRNKKKQGIQPKIIPAQSIKKPKSSSVPIIAPTPANNTGSITLLRDKLMQLYKSTPSRAIRQALWHLDSLVVIEETLANSKKTGSDCLALSTLVTQCAQKVLEQTYRFCVKEEDAPLVRIHNLKTYHRLYQSNFTSYPPIVMQLFLANNWCRYFYKDHQRWSQTSRLATPPPILNSLVQMAEGRDLSPQNLEKLLKGTIESTRQHVEALLDLEKVSTPSLILPKKAFLLKESLPLKTFDAVRLKLNHLLVKSNFNTHHPIHLAIKQVLAALKMQKTCLSKINESKDIPTFSTWTVWSLQQLQESIENALHCIEYFQDSTMSINHEIQALAEKVNLDMGPLTNAFQTLSYKVRYPVEISVDTLPGQIIDDLEVLKHHPEILDGFKLHGLSNMLWAKPSENATPDAIVAKLKVLMKDSEEFLRLKAIPALENLIEAPLKQDLGN